MIERIAVAGAALLACAFVQGEIPVDASGGEWPVYGADKAGTKYSPLDQIDRDNFEELEIAWRWRSVDDAIRARDAYLNKNMFEATPLVIGDTLYLTTAFSRAVALSLARRQQLERVFHVC